jgi:hypothetical protein
MCTDGNTIENHVWGTNVYICIYIYVCVYIYISRIAHFHVGSLFQDLLNCCGHVTSVSVSPASDGPGRLVPSGRKAVSNKKSTDCCTA